MAAGATGAAAAAAAIVNAVKASGVVVAVNHEEFLKILARSTDPLIVTSKGGIFKTHYEYLLSYKGLAFYTESAELLTLPADAEIVQADKIWVPNL